MSFKILTLIPAFKIEFIEVVLSSIINQTLLPDIVVISDDSPDGVLTSKIGEFLKKFDISSIDFIFIEGARKGATENIFRLINYVKDFDFDLTHIFFDDDIIFPKFYEVHSYFFNNSDINLSISKRTVVDKLGYSINKYSYPDSIEYLNSRFLLLERDFLYKSTVIDNVNWMGEYSNCVFKKQYVLRACKSQLENIPYWGLGDVGFFLEVAEESKIGFLNDYLGSFRISRESNTSNKNLPVTKVGVVAWLAIGIYGWSKGFISDGELSLCALKVFKNYVGLYGFDNSNILQCVKSVALLDQDFSEKFIMAWFEFIMSFPEGLLYLNNINE